MSQCHPEGMPASHNVAGLLLNSKCRSVSSFGDDVILRDVLSRVPGFCRLVLSVPRQCVLSTAALATALPAQLAALSSCVLMVSRPSRAAIILVEPSYPSRRWRMEKEVSA
jgi:hypothetical protein